MRLRPGLARRILVSFALGLAILTGVIVLLENSFVYHPDVHPSGDWEAGWVKVKPVDRYMLTADRVRIHGWWFPNPRNEGALLFFHGNAGNITHRLYNIHGLLSHTGLSVFIIDYRGYGRSAGRPDEEGLYRDADAAYEHLVNQLKVAPSRIIVFGRSLGGGVASYVAETRRCAGLILESTFTSVPGLVRGMFPFFLPVHLFVRHRFDNLERVGRIQVPKLIVHGTEDTLIPFTHGVRLHEGAIGPKEMYSIPRAGHNDTVEIGGEPYYRRLAAFAASCLGSR